MAAYLAMRIESGKLNYKTVFANQIYKRYQEEVDAILIADGKDELIVQ